MHKHNPGIISGEHQVVQAPVGTTRHRSFQWSSVPSITRYQVHTVVFLVAQASFYLPVPDFFPPRSSPPLRPHPINLPKFHPPRNKPRPPTLFSPTPPFVLHATISRVQSRCCIISGTSRPALRRSARARLLRWHPCRELSQASSLRRFGYPPDKKKSWITEMLTSSLPVLPGTASTHHVSTL